MPLLLTCVTAALLFALVRRVSDVWTALLAWAVWLTAPIVLRFQPTYFSEITTGALLLASWWCLLEWRATGARRWLVGLALAVGWSAITRPLTALAFAIPIGVVVLRDVAMRRRWLDLAVGVAAGCAVLAILPLWSARTTGSWRESPLARYRLDYMPYDRMGFTVDTTPPRLAVTPVVAKLNARLLERHREQTLAELPGTARSRMYHLWRGVFEEWRLPLGALAIVGLVTATAPVWFAIASAVAVFAAYLGYAYHNLWTLYFLETTPVLAALAALGARWLAARLNGDRARASLGLMSLAVLALGGATHVQRSRAEHRFFESFDRKFLAALEQLPRRPAIVFVRDAQRFADHLAVLRTYPDLEAAPVWVVHDLGPRNEELKRVAPDRATYEFSEEQVVR
jgi:4-amino-4-deoxy-L-arabinose transferase-like glycosyltransferase